jgi:predicted RNA-binding Zn-ribbon protein involved in translation (DUF1610 family)
MAQTLNCSSCGGTVEITGSAATTKCPFCNTTLVVPEELRQVEAQTELTASAKTWGRYLIILLIITVGLPTLIGLCGSALGICAGVGAPLLALLLQLFFQH